MREYFKPLNQHPIGNQFLEQVTIWRLSSPNLRVKKIFVAHAWEDEANGMRSWEQAQIKTLVEDLRAAGFDVFFDIDAMWGRLETTMQKELSESDVVVPICTPRFAERVKQSSTNAAFEFRLLSEKGRINPSSICPIHLLGSFNDAVPEALRAYIVYNFTDAKSYVYGLTGLHNPLGLLPVLLDVDPTRQESIASYKSLHRPLYLHELSCLPNVPRGLLSRESLNERIFAKFTQQTERKVVVLHGMAGVGKTQMLCQFSQYETTKRDYDIRTWIPAETPTTIEAAFANLAKRLGVNIAQTPFSEWLPIIYQRLNSERCLFIFDNAPNASMLAPYLPTNTNHHCLASSRSDNWPHTVSVSIFSQSEARQYLQNILTRERDNDIDLLAEKLGHLPLALKQAAFYIRHERLSINQYLALYNQEGLRLLDIDAPTPLIENDERLCHDIVTRTWLISLDQLQQHHNKAKTLLMFCAYLNPDDLSLEVLQAVATNHNISSQEVISLRTILRDYGLLLATEENHHTIHRLLQLVIQETLHIQPGDHNILHQILGPLATVFTSRLGTRDEQLANPSTFSAWLAHADVWWQGYHALHDVLLSELNSFNHELHNDISVVETSINIAECANSMGNLFSIQGQLDKARECFKVALLLKEKIHGANDIAVASTLIDSGATERDLGGQPGIAKPILERALNIMLPVYGENHLETARVLNHLGDVERDLRNPTTAKSYYERSLAILAFLGVDNAKTATTLVNLANTERSLGELELSVDYYLRALSVFENQYGNEHSEVARTLMNLGIAENRMQQTAAARRHLQRSLELNERIYGNDHVHVAVVLFNLGNVEYDAHNPAQAKIHLDRALIINRRGYGEEHEHVVRTLTMVALCELALQDFPNAQTHVNRANDIAIRSNSNQGFKSWVQQTHDHIHNFLPRPNQAVRQPAIGDPNLMRL